MGFVIAVDGPAASGKGTIAAALARDFDLPFLDTGLLYRAVGEHTVRELGAGLHDPRAREVAAAVAADIQRDWLDDPSLRRREAGELASQVAVWPEVRDALLNYQRSFANQPGGAVLDGRDIGTVIAPTAQAKLFVTARPEIRAERRWLQLTRQKEVVEYEDVLADIRRRDDRDSGRAAAPLTMAEDAVLLDTSEMTIDAAFREARRLVEIARSSKG